MYWLVLSTLFWAASYGSYASKEACEAAAKEAPIYVSASCIPLPVKAAAEQPHKH
jgi:hypothetical protein